MDVGAAYGTHRWLPDVANAIRDAVADLGEDDIVAIGLGIPRVVDVVGAALARVSSDAVPGREPDCCATRRSDRDVVAK